VSDLETIKANQVRAWLPYWAVLQADVRQTTRSWVYRLWVVASVLFAVGYFLYRLGVYKEAGMIQDASKLMSDLLRWSVYGSATLIIVLTAGCISSERGTLADSVLSRGISRFQYFLGKWHSRLATVLGTYLVLGVLAIACSYCLLHEDLSMSGCVVALLTVGALLAAVVTGGVAASAIFNSTVGAIAVLWITLYGCGFLLSMMPAGYPSPQRALNNLPLILQGEYNTQHLARLLRWASLSCLGMGAAGLAYFARRDV
jgi:ABC-type transport system involved in multi-copper enzyme maturation permease subunit